MNNLGQVLNNFARPLGAFLGFGIFVWLSGANFQAVAEEISMQDQTSFKNIISSQISAFKSGDISRAYEFASPGVKEKFSTIEEFSMMAKNGYPQVYNPRSFKFGELSSKLGSPTQHVHVIGPQGKLWTALYGFEKQPDGTWRISAVALMRRPDAGA